MKKSKSPSIDTKEYNRIISIIDKARLNRRRKMALITNSKVYDWAKWSALVALPALAVFWLAVAPVWGLPYTDQIGKTLVALNVLLGALVGVSGAQYQAEKKK